MTKTFFEILDKDGNGELSVDELKEVGLGMHGFGACELVIGLLKNWGYVSTTVQCMEDRICTLIV